MTRAKITVMVAEDMQVLREALTALLALELDIDVVAEAERGDQVSELVRIHSPDVLVLDIDLPGVDGLTLARKISNDDDVKSRILVLTAFDRPGVVRETIEIGVRAFLPKGVAIDALIDAIRRVHAGEMVISPALLASAFTAGKNPLSEREMAVLRQVAHGASAKDISLELHMALGTVHNHMSRILHKLGVRNRIEAIEFAKERGWL